SYAYYGIYLSYAIDCSISSCVIQGVPGSDAGIFGQYSDGITLFNNTVFEFDFHGIFFYDCYDMDILENTVYWNEGTPFDLCGIYIDSSLLANIEGNNITENSDNGISISGTDNVTITGNHIVDNWNHGVDLQYSDYCVIQDNFIAGHGDADNGITVLSSNSGDIIGNTIYESEFNGIYMSEASDWIISHNVIYDNGGPGIYMDVPTEDNFLYYNDIGWSGEFLAVDEGFGNFWNYTGIGNWYSDYEETGTYTIAGAGSEVDYYPSMSLYCGVTDPAEYEVGTTGNTMTWNSSALNPGTYELLIDGVPQGHIAWDGSAIAADVDGLPVGVYNITLVVYHVSGHLLANQSTLTVVDTMSPTWTLTPVDQTLEYNEALSYQIEASDASGISSWAVNDTASFAISATGLLTNATFLAPGVYNVEITVTDAYSHSISTTIMITVNEIVLPPSDPTGLVLAIGGIGAVAVIILIVFVLKKKGT
ncbi:MAG: right-handed parallel beta-helix repeat-containing protein, partial [Candidatus Thorarchaeota archaeon]